MTGPTIDLVFATHSTTLDNEHGIATGWLPGELSAVGREQARALGERYRDAVDVVFSSDLARATQTAALAFDGSALPAFLDQRLREYNYGRLNGHPAAEVHATRLAHPGVPYPGGESYLDVATRVESFLADLRQRWPGARVLVIGHAATRYALDYLLAGADLARTLAAPGEWQPGWEYVVRN